MDQLLAKIRETHAASQQADAARARAQLDYYRAVEQAHERLTAWHNAEHDLLMILIQQQRASDNAAPAVPAPQASLPAVPEEVEKTDEIEKIETANVTDQAPRK